MRTGNLRYALFLALVCSITSTVHGQAPAQAPPPDPAPAPKPWSAGGIDFSGLVDGYYSLNFNHPASKTNNIRNFDVRANSFSLNMAKLVAEHSADPVGFKVDLMFGRAAEIFHLTEPMQDGRDVMRNILQAYVSVKPKNMNGFQLDFGKFVTSAGAELTETHLNWNYSRALIYANGPYYHFGLRASQPLNDKFSVGFQLVNGWNNVEDNNSGKTMGFTTALVMPKFTWNNNYYVGPEKANTNSGFRHFYDTVLLLTPSSKFNAYLNFDYGVDKGAAGDPDKDWVTFGGAAKFQLTDAFAISPRLEWYNDRDGFITGTAQELKEFTMTFEHKLAEGFLSRFEYRRDWSDKPFFDRGNELASSKSQSTLLVGLVVFFGPK